MGIFNRQGEGQTTVPKSQKVRREREREDRGTKCRRRGVPCCVCPYGERKNKLGLDMLDTLLVQGGGLPGVSKTWAR